MARDNFTVTNTISAAQRVTAIAVSSNIDQIPPSLVPSVTYTPWGALQTLQNGCYGTNCTTVQETYDYNNRMQPVRIQLGTASNNPANYCQVYDYYGVSPTSCTNNPTQAANGNNGNVRRYWYNDNVTSTYSHTATYTYDNVNRLATAVAAGSSAYNLTFDYTHDGSNGQYGNMHCTATQGLCDTTLAFSASTNRITTSGYTYDAAGNLTGDGTYTYQWDAEGRLTQAAAGGTTMHTYTYNALGQRVEDVPGNSLTTQELAYDPFGQLLGHFFNYPPQRDWWHIMVPALGRIMVNSEQWYVGNAWIYHYNALGSAVETTDHTGSPLQDTLVYPWGQPWQGGTGIYAGLFSMQCQLDPCFDQSQTRDYPTNLGRWLSPDPLAGDISNPQSLNRYAYVLNNPTSLTDPLGLGPKDPCDLHPNSIACGRDPGSNIGNGPGMFAPGLDEFDLAAMGLLPTGLPGAAFCGAQFASCAVYAGGVVGFDSSGFADLSNFDQIASAGANGEPFGSPTELLMFNGGQGSNIDYFNLRLTATSDNCSPQGRQIQYGVTTRNGSSVTSPNFYVYEVVSPQFLARGGPFHGTTYDYPNQFTDTINPGLSSVRAIQQFGVSLTRPNASGVPGGHLIPINWSAFGGGVVGQNTIQMSAGSVVINGVPCHN